MRSCHTSRSTSRSSGDWCRALEVALGVLGAGKPYCPRFSSRWTCSKSHFLLQPDFVDRRPEPWRRCGEVQAARVSLSPCSCPVLWPQLRGSVLDPRLTGSALGDPQKAFAPLALWTLHRLHGLRLPWESGQVCQQPGCKHLVPLVLMCCRALLSKSRCCCWPACGYLSR